MKDYSIYKSIGQYRFAKLNNIKLAASLRRIGYERWYDVQRCAEVMQVKYCPVCGQMHADVPMVCRHRLCPVCALRRSRKVGAQALEAFAHMRDAGQLDGARLLLLTLTQRNVCRDELGGEIDKLLAALTSMRKVRSVSRALIGSARNIEITYNAEADTFHPHVHMIVILSAEADDDMMYSQYWRDLWRRLMKLDYDPICDIRPITDDQGAVCEVSKYCIKPGSIFGLELSDAVFDNVIQAITAALAGRHLIAYTGIWKKMRAQLKQKEPDDDLEHDETSDVCGCGAGLMDALLRWNGLEYVSEIRK